MAQSTNNAAKMNKSTQRNIEKKQSKSKNQNLGIRAEEEVKNRSLDRQDADRYTKQYPLNASGGAVRQEIDEDEY